MHSYVYIYIKLYFMLWQPAAGTPVPSNDRVSVTCRYSSDPTVVLGVLSTVFLIVSTVVGYMSLFYPYKGKIVPQGAMLKHFCFSAFFNVALYVSSPFVFQIFIKFSATKSQ